MISTDCRNSPIVNVYLIAYYSRARGRFPMKPRSSIALPKVVIPIFLLVFALLQNLRSQPGSVLRIYELPLAKTWKIVAGGFITGIIPHPIVPGVTFCAHRHRWRLSLQPIFQEMDSLDRHLQPKRLEFDGH